MRGLPRGTSTTFPRYRVTWAGLNGAKVTTDFYYRTSAVICLNKAVLDYGHPDARLIVRRIPPTHRQTA